MEIDIQGIIINCNYFVKRPRSLQWNEFFFHGASGSVVHCLNDEVAKSRKQRKSVDIIIIYAIHDGTKRCTTHHC